MHWLVGRWGRHFHWAWLCDRMDIALGVPDTPQNLPRRHGYVRLSHQASGTWNSQPEDLYCHRCARPMTDWEQPCILVKVRT